ncbi:acetyltransferase family protein, partial [Vibrio parahaemolyticus V-223/04]
MLVLVGDPR